MTALLTLLMKFGPALLGFLPHLGDVINAVEGIFGPTSATNGETKLQLSLDLVKQVAPELEAAFGVSPAFQDVISAGISLAVQIMQLQGTLTGVVTPGSAVAAAVVANPAMVAAAQASAVQQP